jgi:NAD(P)-dependent dehydrogenase (short-subunit alcohol dehydrogenase family)
MMKNLRDRVAVVTGAASGIGLAMAKRFAHEGMKLVLADVEEEPLQAACSLFSGMPCEVISLRTDVRFEAELKALADAAYERFGAVHVLCNNAGVAAGAAGLRTHAWDSSLADWEWTMDVNFMGVLYGVRAFVPRMLAGGEEGHIVNTASVAGLLSGATPYHVSKHAVACLTEGLYRDLKSTGSKVSASVLCPGLIRTDILNAERNRPVEYGPGNKIETLTDQARHFSSEFRRALESGYEPAQVADAVAEAILSDRYYVIPAQPHLIELIRLRMEDIVQQRNPSLVKPL